MLRETQNGLNKELNKERVLTRPTRNRLNKELNKELVLTRA